MTDERPIRQCTHRKANGDQCKHNAMPGRRFCYLASHCGDAPGGTRIKNFFQNNWWKVITGVFTLVVGIPALYAYGTRISVVPAGSIRSHEPLGTIFNVTNDGMLTLHNVSHLCGIASGEGEIAGGGKVLLKGVTSTPEGAFLGDLPTGATKSLSCEKPFVGFEGEASIWIEITYTRPLWYRSTKKYFFFESEKANNGTWVWKSK